MPGKNSEALPPELASQIAPLMKHAVRVQRDEPLAIAVYCNCCEHEIRRHGVHEWQCIRTPPCRCMMIGCVPKTWSEES